MFPIKNRAGLLLMGLLMMFTLGVMYTWSLFRVPILEQYAWSEGQLSVTFSIVTACFALGGLTGGKLGERFSSPVCVRIAAVLCLTGYVGASLLPADAQRALLLFYLCYGICTGLGIGIGYNGVIGSITASFSGNSGTVAGILLAAYGFSSMIVGQMIQEALSCAIPINGIFRCMGICLFLILMAGSFFLDTPHRTQSDSEKSIGSFTPKEMMCTPTFWMLLLWNIAMSSASLLILNCSADVAQFFGGTAAMGMILSVSNGICRSFIGNFFDRLGYKVVIPFISLAQVLAGATLLLGALQHSLAWIICGLLLCGIAYGGGITTNAAATRQLYGSQYYSTNFAIISLGVLPASMVNALLSGLLHPNASAGYEGLFLGVFCLAAFAQGIALILLFIRKN